MGAHDMASPPLDDPSRFDSMGSLPMGPQHPHGAPELPCSPPSPHSSSQYSANFRGIDDPDNHFEHTPAQRCDFHTFFRMGAGLPREDLLTWGYLLGHSFHVENKLDRRDVDITALTDDLHVCLKVTFALNKEQAANIRLVAQDLIYLSDQTTYLSLFLDVEVRVQTLSSADPRAEATPTPGPGLQGMEVACDY
ncbi:hypothetical protein JB92DRAFT_3120945 [Gautieria morchelliformis]|nr:hypothetical protein JB92DRAFT_3120945 [Gautieria morchelliformis]